MTRVSLLAAMFVLAACGGGGDTAAVSTAAAPTRQAPELAGRTLDGEHVSLADLRGKPVVVNVWSSW